MTTPQKIFLENSHFWILPLILIILKFFFDLLPRIIFISLFSLLLFLLYSKNQIIKKQEEIKEKELEDKREQFLDELNEEEKEREEKENLKKLKKIKVIESRIKNQEKQKVNEIIYFFYPFTHTL